MDSFLNLTKILVTASRSEPGNIRFDVIQSKDKPAEFSIFEIFTSAADKEIHAKSAHVNNWKVATASMILEKSSSPYNLIF